MITNLRPLTIADWDAMPHGDGNRYEIIEGELFKSSWPGISHQIILGNLILSIRTFLETNPMGIVVCNPPVILSNFSGVFPDVVFFLNEQRETIITDDRLTGPPALIIEVVSPGFVNIGRDCGAKLKLYSKHKVPEYWIAYPKNMNLQKYVSRGDSWVRLNTLRSGDTLTSAALPGFSCPVSEIFRQF